LKKIESAIKSAPLPPRKLTKSEALSEPIPELKKQHDRATQPPAWRLHWAQMACLLVSERKLVALLRQQASVSLA